MAASADILAAICQAAPPGLVHLDEATVERLRALTEALIDARPDADEEYRRFLAIGQRELPLDGAALDRWLGGKSILVTGGTGCIGSLLMSALAEHRPGRLASLSRGHTQGWPRVSGAEYVHADVRDQAALMAAFDDVKPDIVFHVAAQRSPALAEIEVHRTVTTNVFGTRNVINAASRLQVPQVVCASTGKALRPYTPDVYAASKRAAEWVVACAAVGSLTRYSAARFTHVVDNSIIHQRLQDWSADGVIRLHGADIVFYAQSGLESAQLLLQAGLNATAGSFLVHALSDLGWPVGLLDMAIGVLRDKGSSSPIYISGHDPGYESMAFPGLYDPDTAGDLSPLLSAFEAADARKSPCQSVDFFPLTFAPDPEPDKRMLALEEICSLTQDPDEVRGALDQLSWTLLDAALRAVPAGTLARAVAVTAPHRALLTGEHQRMLAAIERQVPVTDAPGGPRSAS